MLNGHCFLYGRNFGTLILKSNILLGPIIFPYYKPKFKKMDIQITQNIIENIDSYDDVCQSQHGQHFTR